MHDKEGPSSPESSASPALALRLARARHDLNNCIGHILGFADILLEELQEKSQDRLRPELESIKRTARQLMMQVNEALSATALDPGLTHLASSKQRFCQDSSHIIAVAETLVQNIDPAADGVFKSDLSRILGAGRHASNLASAALACLSEPPAEGAPRLPADWLRAHFQPLAS